MTMTSIVGILCKDGVVIGADSSATFANGQFRTIEQPMEKIEIIGNHVIVVGTGQVGLGQRFCEIVRKAWNEKAFSSSPVDVGKFLSGTAINDFVQTSAPKGQYGAFVAFPSNHRPQLCEFAVPDFQPELRTENIWYGSMGSAQPITDPFLGLIREVFWSNGMPSLQDGVFATTWTLDYAVKVNPGGVNGPVRIAVLELIKGQSEARIISDDELGEHRQNIEEAKKALRDFKLAHQPDKQNAIPSLPEARL
jgi:hypothetical protein